MDKVIKLTTEEYEALISYFDDTSINITNMIKKKGLKQTKAFEAAVDKIYEIDDSREN